MCKVYNTIGCLTNIKSHLDEQRIYDFKSVKELIRFQKNYADVRENIIREHEHIIDQEKKNLGEAITQLSESIETTKSDTKQKLEQELTDLKLQLKNLHAPTTVMKVFAYYFKKAILWVKDTILKSV